MSQSVKSPPVYKVEPLKKEPHETDAQALERILNVEADSGWEIVEACGDETRHPQLIFTKRADTATPEYKVVEVPGVVGSTEVQDVNEMLDSMNADGWLPLTVLDAPLARPIGVFKHVNVKPANENVIAVLLPLGVFEKTEPALMEELTSRALRDRRSLITIMHFGLYPALVFTTSENVPHEEYLVEYAQSGIFRNETKSLNELIAARAKEGWFVSGAFEDELLWPCVVFRRPISA